MDYTLLRLATSVFPEIVPLPTRTAKSTYQLRTTVVQPCVSPPVVCAAVDLGNRR
jgi:hypothetical protein